MYRKKPTDVMIDIETAGTKPGCVILSIGACTLVDEPNEFYIRIDPQSSREIGLSISAQTMAWWNKQPRETRDEAFSGDVNVREALFEFSDWLLQLGEIRVWGNGASFDVPILEAAYEKCGIKIPWKYTQSMCYRTMRSLYPHIAFVDPEMKHSAIEDARAQAEHLRKIFDYMQALEDAV